MNDLSVKVLASTDFGTNIGKKIFNFSPKSQFTSACKTQLFLTEYINIRLPTLLGHLAPLVFGGMGHREGQWIQSYRVTCGIYGE